LYRFIQKKRNKLLHQILNDIVYVGYNHKNKSRFQARHEKKGKVLTLWLLRILVRIMSGLIQPMCILTELGGCDNENGLTWGLVDDVIGASSSLHGHNFPRSASRKGARIPVVDEDEDDSTDGDGEEEEDPHDDADVIDLEDANGSNDARQTAAPEIDKFEDVY
jgi:hypothetical protein